MKAHFVRFYAPGVITAEVYDYLINRWDVDEAVELAKTAISRNNSNIYGFCFLTKERKAKELDSHIVKESRMYYLCGKLRTLEEIRREGNPGNRILLLNMEGNHWSKVVETRGVWTLPFHDGDTILDFKLNDATEVR